MIARWLFVIAVALGSIVATAAMLFVVVGLPLLLLLSMTEAL